GVAPGRGADPMSVPAPVQQAVRARAQGRCEYGHAPEWGGAARFTLDHLGPRSRGGTEALEHLALACRRCNERRYTFTPGRDPVTPQAVPLLHPVGEPWAARFARAPAGQWMGGTTPTGRATVERVELNDERHDDGFIRMSRALWVEGGWHPPAGDPVVP